VSLPLHLKVLYETGHGARHQHFVSALDDDEVALRGAGFRTVVRLEGFARRVTTHVGSKVV
jgi:hypothetical protein